MDFFQSVDNEALEFDKARPGFFGFASFAHHCGGVFGAGASVFDGGFGFGPDIFLDAVEDGEEFEEFSVLFGAGFGVCLFDHSLLCGERCFLHLDTI